MKENAVIIDIDGTLLNSTHRGIYEFDKMTNDVATEIGQLPFALMQTGVKVIILSARVNFTSHDIERKTRVTLSKNGILFDEIYLQPQTEVVDLIKGTYNAQKDIQFKLDTIKSLRERFNIQFVIEDSQEVIDAIQKEFPILCLKVIHPIKRASITK